MTCTLTVLGCSGGIGSHRRTTSFLLNEDTLIDCGTGVGDLTLEQLAKVDRVFLTHSHLDHIACLPLLLDSVGSERMKPVAVFGLAETLGHIDQHIFNDVIWPDFTQIPSPDQPWMSLHPISVGDSINIGSNIHITALPACHSVAAIGYAITSENSTLVFSGDTGPCAEFWKALKKLNNLTHVLVECSFVNNEAALAKISGHYHPESLVEMLNKHAPSKVQVWISHLKPGSEQAILEQITPAITNEINALAPGQTIRF